MANMCGVICHMCMQTPAIGADYARKTLSHINYMISEVAFTSVDLQNQRCNLGLAK